MSEITGSFTRVNYLLRPSKQVERKMVIEALQRLSPFGYDIPSYRYIGMGSIYYVDFIMFYKHLHITDMLCVEKRSIEDRMNFNKPYEFVQLHMGAVAEVIPALDRSRLHFVWLDYDNPLNDQIVDDLAAVVKVLAPGSIVMVTVTAELMEVERAETLDQMQERRRRLAGKYQEWFGQYLEEEVRPNMLSRKNLPVLFSRVLGHVVKDRVRERTDAPLDFLQIFNYRYADEQVMLTYGGIIDTAAKLDSIRESDFFGHPFAITSEEPAVISVPQLTVREKHWLDQNRDTLVADPTRIAFELEPEELEKFTRYYKYYPVYYETLV